MTTPLQWRPYQKSDRTELQRFICTDPPSKTWDGRKKVHPRPWELDVQSFVRIHKPRVESGDSMLLGLDEHGIAAICAWSGYANRPGRVLLQAIAVAMRHRRCGGACAKEALATCMGMIDQGARVAGASDLAIEARIHRSNAPSKALFARAGFTCAEMATEELEAWRYFEIL